MDGYLPSQVKCGTSAEVAANRGVAGIWEKFFLVPQGGNKVAILTHDGRYYVTAEGSGGQGLRANRDGVGDWEMFEVVADSRSTVSFKTSEGHWVSAEPDGTLNARPTRRDRWEQFVVFDHSVAVDNTPVYFREPVAIKSWMVMRLASPLPRPPRPRCTHDSPPLLVCHCRVHTGSRSTAVIQ